MKYLFFLFCLFTVLPLWAVRDTESITIPNQLKRPITEQELADYQTSRPEIARDLNNQERFTFNREVTVFSGAQNQELLARNSIANMEQENQATNAEIQSFSKLTGAQIPTVKQETAPIVETEIKVEHNPDDMVVTSDGGCYMDEQKGMLVYMDNVRLRHPNYYMDCKDQVKVFLDQDTQKKKTDKKSKGENSSDKKKDINIKKIVAIGNVTLKYTDKEGKLSEAHGDKITYNVATQELLVSGGYPYIKTDQIYYQSKSSKGFLRKVGKEIYFHGSADTIISNISELEKSANKNKKNK